MLVTSDTFQSRIAPHSLFEHKPRTGCCSRHAVMAERTVLSSRARGVGAGTCGDDGEGNGLGDSGGGGTRPRSGGGPGPARGATSAANQGLAHFPWTLNARFCEVSSWHYLPEWL